MASVAITVARYFLELTELPLAPAAVAVTALLLLTGINCLGVRTGATVQSGLMVLKILAIAALVLGGWWFATAHPDIARSPAEAEPVSLGTLAAIGAAMTPTLFAYGGWQRSEERRGGQECVGPCRIRGWQFY